MKLKKINLVYYSTLIFILILIIEFCSYFVINIFKNSDFIIHREFTNKFNNQEYLNTNKFLFNPYVKHEQYLKKLNSKPDLYLADETFKIIQNTNKNNTILFQGDSWVEFMRTQKEVNSLVSKYAVNNNFSIVSGGTSSFSLSLYIAQLKIFKTYYDLNPKKIVLVLDQTDFGDELYKRSYYHHLALKTSVQHYAELEKILKGTNFNFFKIFKVIYKKFYFYKTYYNNDTTDTIKLFNKKIKSKITKLPIVLFPLKYGIKENEKKHFENLLKIYFNLALSDDLEKIFIVTFPHKNHLNNIYKFNISTIVNEYIKKNNLYKKVEHIDFNKIIIYNKIDTSNFFVQDDIFSHLNLKTNINFFYHTILKKIIQK